MGPLLDELIAQGDVTYVAALIGRDMASTVPVETLDAYREHGEPKDRIEQEAVEAHQMLDRLPELGIGIDAGIQQLED